MVVPKEVLVYVVVGKHFRALELLPDHNEFRMVLKMVKICTGLGTGGLFYGRFVGSLEISHLTLVSRSEMGN